MARMTIDTDARDRARDALVAATHDYDEALRKVENARFAQHAAIVDARDEGIRQVDITGLTQTSARARGFTREHVRRIELRFRKCLAYARDQGMDLDALTTEDVLRIKLPGEEDKPTAAVVDDVDDDLDDGDADDLTDDDADDDADELEPAGVVA